MLVRSSCASGERSTGISGADFRFRISAFAFHSLGVALDLLHEFRGEPDAVALLALGKRSLQPSETISLVEQAQRLVQDGVGVRIESGFKFFANQVFQPRRKCDTHEVSSCRSAYQNGGGLGGGSLRPPSYAIR